MRRKIALPIVFALAGMLLLPGPSALGWSAVCSQQGSDNGRWFEGREVQPQNANYIDGVEAAVDLRHAGLCGSLSHASSWWIMMSPTSGGSGWAQIGYQHDAVSGYSYFWQATKGGAQAGDAWGNPALNDSHQFNVKRANPASCQSQTGYCIVMYRDGVLCHTDAGGATVCQMVNWDPHAQWGGTRADLSGEVIYSGDDMPGGTNNKTAFSGITEKDGANWVSDPWTILSGPCSWYKSSGGSPYNEFHIWTDPLDHPAGGC